MSVEAPAKFDAEKADNFEDVSVYELPKTFVLSSELNPPSSFFLLLQIEKQYAPASLGTSDSRALLTSLYSSPGSLLPSSSTCRFVRSKLESPPRHASSKLTFSSFLPSLPPSLFSLPFFRPHTGLREAHLHRPSQPSETLSVSLNPPLSPSSGKEGNRKAHDLFLPHPSLGHHHLPVLPFFQTASTISSWPISTPLSLLSSRPTTTTKLSERWTRTL